MSVDFPIYRPRRTRATGNLRAMIRETEVSVKDLIYPIFVVPGTNVKHDIEHYHLHYQKENTTEYGTQNLEKGKRYLQERIKKEQ